MDQRNDGEPDNDYGGQAMCVLCLPTPSLLRAAGIRAARIQYWHYRSVLIMLQSAENVQTIACNYNEWKTYHSNTFFWVV
jgi:hypothetical protein